MPRIPARLFLKEKERGFFFFLIEIFPSFVGIVYLCISRSN